MDERGPLGFISLADTLRPDAADTVKAIGDAGVNTILLTGDIGQAAEHIAGLAGVCYLPALFRIRASSIFLRILR